MEAQVNRKVVKGKPRVELIPWPALELIAAGLEEGVRKHGENNYLVGGSWKTYAAACIRHLYKWLWKEDVDPDSGLHHLALAGASLVILLTYVTESIGTDDRK